MRTFRLAFVFVFGSVGFFHFVTHCFAQESAPRARARRSVERRRPPAPTEVIVRFRDAVPTGAIQGLPEGAGARLSKAHRFSGLHRFPVPEGVSPEEVLAAFRKNPLVAEVGLNREVRALEVPNDTNFIYHWHLHSTDGGMWADSAWDLARNRGEGVVVAVIDTGVAYEYWSDTVSGFPQDFVRAPDLASTRFVSPWDFNNNDSHANDDNGHGTHVTGTIVQDTGNAFGEAGVAHNSTIMPLKVLDYSGSGSADDLVEAIYYAVANGARVINMSLGIPDTGGPDAQGNVCSEIVGLNAALEFAHSRGVVVVAAAGNDGGTTVLCPAASPTVIAVGASGFDGQTAFYSNSGAALDITAPGGDPGVDQDGDGYADEVLQETFCDDWLTLLLLGRYDSFCDVFYSGTSMATPHVAGTAALLLGENSGLTPDEVRSHLESTARDRGAPGWDSSSGWGLLDAGAAVASVLGVPPPSPPPGPAGPTDLTATAVSSTQIDLNWTDNAANETRFTIERSTDGGASFTSLAVLGANVTSYSNVNLGAGNTYHYRVRAYEGPYPSPYSNVASAKTVPLPGAPTGLTATAVSPSRIDLRWTDNATNETGFKIERSSDGVSFQQIATRGANATTYSNTSLTAGTTYYYRVRAYSGGNHTDYSNVASGTTQAAPAAPTNLTATAASSSRIDLQWTDIATNEAGYEIERSIDGVSFTPIATRSANATTYTSTGLSADTLYYYRVRAYEGPNHSGFSNVASGTTQAAPAAPAGLAAIVVSSSRIDIQWIDNATNEAGFKIERSIDGVSFSQIATRNANVTTYSNTSLTANVTYYYRVRAYDGPNHSAYSNVASGTTGAAPAAPTNVSATALSSSRIDLSWTDNATDEAGFKIERSSDGVSFSQVASVGANATTYSSPNLQASSTYYYRVRAYDGPNDSSYSNVASATTAPAPPVPTSLVAAAVSSSRIDLTWTDNATYEAGFKVERSTDGVSFSQIVILTFPNVTQYSNTNLPAATVYYYRVRAYDGTNHSEYSTVAVATTEPPPAAPTNLTATAISSTRIDLSWTDNATNEAGFKIERSTDGVNFSQITTRGANATTYSNTGLARNTTYYYRVRAYDGPNHSAYSGAASAKTLP